LVIEEVKNAKNLIILFFFLWIGLSRYNRNLANKCNIELSCGGMTEV